MIKQDRVVITGMGVVSASANNIAEFSRALRDGKSGIRFIEELERLKFSCQVGGVPQGVDELKEQYFAPDEMSGINETMTYAGIAAVDAYRDAGLLIPDRTDDDAVDYDTGAIIGSGIGGMDTIVEKIYPKLSIGKVRRMGSTIVEQVMGSSVSARIGGVLALGNQVTSNSSACSTGTEALIMGAERIRFGLAKRMVVGGADGSSPYSWGGFDSMRVLAKKWNDDPEKASRPMSASAGGFVPSSGCGVLVIENLETALERGARIYAEIVGTSVSSGGMRSGGSMTAPSPDGVVRCVRTAVLHSDIQPSEIDYINGHLTATFADPHELNNWSRALEIDPENFPKINSTKSLIGHSLGATGAIECIATVLQMHEGYIHGSLNCEDIHPDLEMYHSNIVQQTENCQINVAAKASFGFGDVNSCIIFKKWKG